MYDEYLMFFEANDSRSSIYRRQNKIDRFLLFTGSLNGGGVSVGGVGVGKCETGEKK